MALPQLATRRLRLVLAQPGVETGMARFFEENFAGHLDRWSPPPPPGGLGISYWEGKLAQFAREYEEGRSARWLMLFAEPQATEIVGTFSFTQIARGPFQACYLGYQIARRHEGHGLMFEALEAAIAHAFGEMRLHRIMANYRPENERSGRLLERLGFVTEGLARGYLFIDGAWRDHVLASRTNVDFDPGWLATPAASP
jgi:ribosomal-protein-alanine N-acetyltransferase